MKRSLLFLSIACLGYSSCTNAANRIFVKNFGDEPIWVQIAKFNGTAAYKVHDTNGEVKEVTAMTLDHDFEQSYEESKKGVVVEPGERRSFEMGENQHFSYACIKNKIQRPNSFATCGNVAKMYPWRSEMALACSPGAKIPFWWTLRDQFHKVAYALGLRDESDKK